MIAAVSLTAFLSYTAGVALFHVSRFSLSTKREVMQLIFFRRLVPFPGLPGMSPRLVFSMSLPPSVTRTVVFRRVASTILCAFYRGDPSSRLLLLHKNFSVTLCVVRNTHVSSLAQESLLATETFPFSL